jgi:hypothetical protein
MYSSDARKPSAQYAKSDSLLRPIERGPLGLPRGAARATPIPDALVGWVRPSEAEQARRAVPVLEAARKLIIADGWCQGALRDERGRWSLYGAIAEAGGGRIESEYARRQLRDVLALDNLPGWNDAPHRLRSEVTGALLRAIRHARRVGGVNRRGGWAVAR